MSDSRTHRILAELAGEPDGLTCRELTDRLGDEEGLGLMRNSTAITRLHGMGYVTRGERGRPTVITSAGRERLALADAGVQPVRGSAHSRMRTSQRIERDRELTDVPQQLLAAAVDGAAPRGLSNSVFNWRQPTEAERAELERACSHEPCTAGAGKCPHGHCSVQQVRAGAARALASRTEDVCIGFYEGSVIEYVCTWRTEGGLQYLKQARKCLDRLITLEEGKAHV